MAGHCFIIDAEGAQFHSQTVLHVLAHFLAFSTHGPSSSFQTNPDELHLFASLSEKSRQRTKY